MMIMVILTIEKYKRGEVVKIYNISGQEFLILVSEKLAPGNHKNKWDAHSFASGVYYYKIEAGSQVQTKKLLLIK